MQSNTLTSSRGQSVGVVVETEYTGFKLPVPINHLSLGELNVKQDQAKVPFTGIRFDPSKGASTGLLFDPSKGAFTTAIV